MNPAIVHCLCAATRVPEQPAVAEWWPRWRDGAARAAQPAAMAVLGGFEADRVAWAFASGYQAALRALLPELPRDIVAAFCVTEDGGNRPRDIRTTITPAADGTLRVSGAKRWTTLGPASSLLLVVGALPPQQGEARPRLKLVRIAADAPGLRLLPMPDTHFVPEVPHARVQLDAVRVDAAQLLPGDGYDSHVKPFRTLEDTHVALASAPADAPATHIALAGALAQAHGLYGEAGTLWTAAGEDPAALRWARDAALFGVAAAARDQRSARAWERLRTAPVG